MQAIRPGHPLEMASARRFAPSGNATTREPVATHRVEEAGPGGIRAGSGWGPGGVRADAGRTPDDSQTALRSPPGST